MLSSIEVDEAVIDYLSKQKRLPNFGNAGAVEQLLKNAMANATVRHRQSPGSSKHGMVQLIVEDIGSEKTRRSGDVGGDPLSLLDGLFGMDTIRKELGRLQKRLQIAQAQGETQPPVGHFVFRGSPGTGKTTVARVMGKILCAMGVLASDKVVETSGLNMTGEYVGSTKKKVETHLDEARGEILFIDEAYEMGKGAYGEEVLTTLVAGMTNPLYKGTVVIIAGYPHDLEVMLSRNVGLKSRFTRFFDFTDWQVEDCVPCLQGKLEAKGYKILDPGAHLALYELFTRLITLPGFGNGRDVESALHSLLECQAERVFDEREAGASAIDMKIITVSDAKEARQLVLKARVPPPSMSVPISAPGVMPWSIFSGLTNPQPLQLPQQFVNQPVIELRREEAIQPAFEIQEQHEVRAEKDKLGRSQQTQALTSIVTRA